jgi:hypothetical protein
VLAQLHEPLKGEKMRGRLVRFAFGLLVPQFAVHALALGVSLNQVN